MDDVYRQWEELHQRLSNGNRLNDFRILLGDLELYEQTLQIVINDIDVSKIIDLIPLFKQEIKDQIKLFKIKDTFQDTMENIEYGKGLLKNLTPSTIHPHDKPTLDKVKSLLDFFNKQLKLLDHVIKYPEEYPSTYNTNILLIIDEVYAEKVFLEEYLSFDNQKYLNPTIKSKISCQEMDKLIPKLYQALSICPCEKDEKSITKGSFCFKHLNKIEHQIIDNIIKQITTNHDYHIVYWPNNNYRSIIPRTKNKKLTGIEAHFNNTGQIIYFAQYVSGSKFGHEIILDDKGEIKNHIIWDTQDEQPITFNCNCYGSPK